jgi:hypothetical protein
VIHRERRGVVRINVLAAGAASIPAIGDGYRAC